MVGAFQGGQAAHGVVELDLAQVSGVAGGYGLGFGGRGADVSAGEVFDFGVDDFVTSHLFDEQCFGFNLLPHDGVVGAFGDVVEDFYALILVALPDDASFALFKVGGTPGNIDVVQCDTAALDVRAGAHFLGGPDEYRDLSACALGP
ncbi:Uncharacterised protein [Mycobacteroides abscessus subsp. abscessus]|nr:Uncharacterised protein [Mycobacteroides abscessus subsp. abscessus]